MLASRQLRATGGGTEHFSSKVMKMKTTAIFMTAWLGCRLLSNYSEVTVITVFWTLNIGYCLFFGRVIMKIGERNQKVTPK